MGKWATYRKRGGGSTPNVQLPAPVLTDNGGGSVIWTWALTDPDHWTLEESADGVSGWVIDTTSAGANRSQTISDPGNFYRMYGATAGNVQSTGYSNVIFAT